MKELSRRWFVTSCLGGATALSGVDGKNSIFAVDSFRIGFGSCLRDSRDARILEKVVHAQPDLFVWLGDNIYGDTTNMGVLQQKYDRLGSNPRFERLRATCPNLAIWDDHDYGPNDSDRGYSFKFEALELFSSSIEDTVVSNLLEAMGDRQDQLPFVQHNSVFQLN